MILYRTPDFWDDVGSCLGSTVKVLSIEANTFIGNRECGAYARICIDGVEHHLQMVGNNTAWETAWVLRPFVQSTEALRDDSEAGDDG